jgi:hypothetical protein
VSMDYFLKLEEALETCTHEDHYTVGLYPGSRKTFCEDCGVELEGQGPDENGRETFGVKL